MKTKKDIQHRFTELLGQNQAIVFKVANTYCWHPDDRDELTQEIVTQLWRAFPGFDETRRFSTWMYRISLNIAISYVRSQRLRQQHFVAFDQQIHDKPQHADQKDEEMEILYGLISELDPLNRALMLLYLEERSYREISDILGISESNVATKINRLKQRIRRQTETATSNRSKINDRSSHYGA